MQRTLGHLVHGMAMRQPPQQATIDALNRLEVLGTVSTDAVVRILMTDPFAALTTLKRANESFYGLRASVGSLTHAVEIIRPDSCVSYFAHADSAGRTSDAIKAVTRHAQATAILAHGLATGQELWTSDSPVRMGMTATTGLLHSLGRLILCVSYPSETDSMYGFSSQAFPVDGTRKELEQLQFGLDHTEVGAFAIRKMHLPDEMSEAVAHMSARRIVLQSSASRRLALTITLASALAEQAGYGLTSQVSFLEQEAHDLKEIAQTTLGWSDDYMNDRLMDLDRQMHAIVDSALHVKPVDRVPAARTPDRAPASPSHSTSRRKSSSASIG